jgi:hypothetical protein
MQIAATGAVTITASQWASDPRSIDTLIGGLEVTPAQALMRRSAGDLMSLQGVASVKYAATAPDQLLVNFATEGFSRLADNVLRDVVDGVRLVLTSSTPTPPGQDDWWAGSINQMISSVRSMPGVIDSTGFREHGLKELMFRTKDAATSARVQALVNDQLDGWRVSWNPFAPKPA